jgi:DNA-binding transcriptional MocR family regulator
LRPVRIPRCSASGILAKAGDVVLSEELTYPGTRSITAQLGLRLVGLPMDDEGVDADAFADACKRLTPRALYLNPTLLNPTTHTISEPRRIAIVAIARRFGVPIIEDDPYGFLPTSGPPPFAALAPDITWHVAGLASASAPDCASLTSWHLTFAQAGYSPRRCEPQP